MCSFNLCKTSTGLQPPPFLFAAGLIQTMARIDFPTSLVLNNKVCSQITLYDNSMKLLTFLNTLSFWDSQTPRVSILFLIEAFWLFTLIIMFLHNPRFTKHPLLLILLECFSALRIALSLIQKRHIPFSNVLPPAVYSARTRFCSSLI